MEPAMTSRPDAPAPRFRAPSALATARDVVVVAVTAALVAAFLAQVWRAPEPREPAAAWAAGAGHHLAG
jgi:hypothetical protein